MIRGQRSPRDAGRRIGDQETDSTRQRKCNRPSGRGGACRRLRRGGHSERRVRILDRISDRDDGPAAVGYGVTHTRARLESHATADGDLDSSVCPHANPDHDNSLRAARNIDRDTRRLDASLQPPVADSRARTSQHTRAKQHGQLGAQSYCAGPVSRYHSYADGSCCAG
jgi:hypothetical protein